MGKYKPIAEPKTPMEMRTMVGDKMQLLVAQRQEASSRATLVSALCVMGRFGEALTLAPDEQKDYVQALIAAENAPDDARCECIALNDVADYARNPNAAPKWVEARKFARRLRHWSEKYNAMVWHYVCTRCGFANALPDDQVPEESIKIADRRNEELKARRQEAYDKEVARIIEKRKQQAEKDKEKNDETAPDTDSPEEEARVPEGPEEPPTKPENPGGKKEK